MAPIYAIEAYEAVRDGAQAAGGYQRQGPVPRQRDLDDAMNHRATVLSPQPSFVPPRQLRRDLATVSAQPVERVHALVDGGEGVNGGEPLDWRVLQQAMVAMAEASLDRLDRDDVGPAPDSGQSKSHARDLSCAGERSWNSESTGAQFWRWRSARVFYSNTDTWPRRAYASDEG